MGHFDSSEHLGSPLIKAERARTDLKRYRPELDGLRAIAVISVVIFHYWPGWAPGGYIGVDVFFVISGFLITSIILGEHDRGAFTFPNFWLRRVRRIFPALVVMLLASSIAAYLSMFRLDLDSVGKHGMAAILSFANVALMRMGSYWGEKADSSLFLHTWSLSVEEQFYFIYPFVIALLVKLERRWILRAMGAIAALSFALYVFGSLRSPVPTFYLLHTRAWELAAGCLSAMLKWNGGLRAPRRVSSFLSLAGLAAIIASSLLLSEKSRFVGALALPVLGAALIILFGEREGSAVNRTLSFPAMVFIGKASYSIYLWHWPILVLARQRPEWSGDALSMAAIVALLAISSLLSYFFVERPTRHRKKILRLALPAFALSLSFSLFLYRSVLSYDCSAYSRSVWRGEAYSVSPLNPWNQEMQRRLIGVEMSRRDAKYAESYLGGGIIHDYGSAKPEVVVLGDSHALMWSGLIDRICEELHETVSFYCSEATTPFISLPLKLSWGNEYFTPEQKYAFDEKRLQYLREWKPKLVIVVTRWSLLHDAHGADDLMRFLGGLGSRVILIEQPPELFFGEKSAMQYLAYMGVAPKGGQRQYIRTADDPGYQEGRELVREVAREYPAASLVPVFDIYYKAGAGAWVLDGPRLLYTDDSHLSQDGAMKLEPRLLDAISASLKGR